MPPFEPGPGLPACTPPYPDNLPACSPPRIYVNGRSPHEIPRGETGVPYMYRFIDAGGAAIASWTFTGLPGWLTESSDGVLTGTPVAAAPLVSFTVLATTPCGTTATVTAAIRVD